MNQEEMLNDVKCSAQIGHIKTLGEGHAFLMACYNQHYISTARLKSILLERLVAEDSANPSFIQSLKDTLRFIDDELNRQETKMLYFIEKYGSKNNENT